MTLSFKFNDPDTTLIKLDPRSGAFETSSSQAQVEYAIDHTVGCSVVELKISSQIFEADDVDDLIAFLECVRQRLCSA